MKKVNFVIFAIFFIAIVVWIGIFTWDYFVSLNEPSLPPSVVENKNKVANPASVFCEEQGGKIKIQESEAGQAGYCVFKDGRICEEWTLFRNGECIPPQD